MLNKNNSNNLKADITAIILTFNEEKHLERSILSINQFIKKIIIIDSFSNDKTLSIAKKYNVKVMQNVFINHSKQLNWALKNVSIKTNWILRMDADEIVEKNFFKKFNKIAKIKKINGIEIIIEHNFLGERIKYGDVYPQRQIRLWKKNHGYFDEKPMDEKIIINKPNIYKSSLRIIDHNLKGLMFWFKKHFKYAEKEAQFYFLLKNKKYMKNNIDKTLLKKIYYYRYPIFIRPILLFLYRYFIKKGFLDGVVGLKFNILQTLFYRLLVDFFIIKKSIKD